MIDFPHILRGSFLEMLNNIQQEYNYVCQERDELRKTLSEWNKDNEIKTLEVEIESLRKLSLEILSEKESMAISKFRELHYEKCKNGSTFEYVLTGTGIGTIIKIKCPKCKEILDVTDSESW